MTSTPRAARPPRPRQKVFEQVVEQIRLDILSGRRGIGDKLPRESDLAALFGVSRTAIREALRVLELQGLVYVYHGYGGGVFVKALDHRPLAVAFQTSLQAGQASSGDVYEARVVLEPMLTRLAVERAGPALAEPLLANLARSRQAVDQAPTRLSLDMEFHFMLADNSGNAVLASIVRSLWDLVADVDGRFPADAAMIQSTSSFHSQIALAVEHGEGTLAEMLMQAHLLNLHDRYTRHEQQVVEPA
jgi:GntR family transcriptional repressor for pyruvate dehydrogenase complex